MSAVQFIISSNIKHVLNTPPRRCMQVGQFVFAIGNTYGLTKTLSAGIVSGLNRSIPSPVGTRIYGVIQTDASISGGNSGGPLLNSAGRMVRTCMA